MRSLGWMMGMLAAGVAAFAACGGETDTVYGPPGGLRNAHLPDPTGTGTVPPPGDGGAARDGGGGDAQAMSCTVSYKTQIFPKMTDQGPWKCANAQCHGGNTPPAISGTDATTTYNSLKATVINGKPYFNPSSTDPAQSSFECNLKGACGAAGMPVPGGATGATAATTAEIADVDTWLKCGSPNN